MQKELIQFFRLLRLYLSLFLAALSNLYTQQQYIVNYENMYSTISDNLPKAPFNGFIELIKHNSFLKCKTQVYVEVFQKQKEYFSVLIKNLKKYIVNIDKNETHKKCIYKYIYNSLKEGGDYIHSVIDTKLQWAKCKITDIQANKKFEKLWKQLFYKFNKKLKRKLAGLFFDTNYGNFDNPYERINQYCIQNAPKMFCEFLNFFMYRAKIVKCDKRVVCSINKKNIENMIDKLHNTFRRLYHGFDELCPKLNIVDYAEEKQEELQENNDKNDSKEHN